MRSPCTTSSTSPCSLSLHSNPSWTKNQIFDHFFLSKPCCGLYMTVLKTTAYVRDFQCIFKKIPWKWKRRAWESTWIKWVRFRWTMLPKFPSKVLSSNALCWVKFQMIWKILNFLLFIEKCWNFYPLSIVLTIWTVWTNLML